MGVVLFPGTFPNNCKALSGGDLQHQSCLLSIECPCVHESDGSVHNMTECTLVHVNKVTGLIFAVLCGIWSLDFFRSVIPPLCSNIKTL